MLLTKEIGIKWILESFVIEEKCKQDSKVLTYSSVPGNKTHGYSVYCNLKLFSCNFGCYYVMFI